MNIANPGVTGFRWLVFAFSLMGSLSYADLRMVEESASPAQRVFAAETALIPSSFSAVIVASSTDGLPDELLAENATFTANASSGEVPPEPMASFSSLASETSMERRGQAFALVGYDSRILFLDSSAGVIFSSAGSGSVPIPFVSDALGKALHMDDFAIPGTDRVAIADNSRQAVFLFRKWRFEKALREYSGRNLFRYIQYLWADPNDGRIGVYDSGRDQTLVFTSRGTLLNERKGRYEPVFWNHRLVRLQKTQQGVEVFSAKPDGEKDRSEISLPCSEGQMVLDAWCAGVTNGRLAIIMYEGKGNEDHPAGGRVSLLKEGKTSEFRIPMNLDLRLGTRRPFVLLNRDEKDYLLEAHPVNDDVVIFGYRIP